VKHGLAQSVRQMVHTVQFQQGLTFPSSSDNMKSHWFTEWRGVMNLTLLDDADVKVVYDSQGVKREVLISYEKYEEILEFIERYAYFYSQEVQERLQKSDEDLQTGRYIEVETADVDKALEWLNE